MGWEVISIQNGGGMLTSSIRRAQGVRTKVGRLRKHSVLKSDWYSVILLNEMVSRPRLGILLILYL